MAAGATMVTCASRGGSGQPPLLTPEAARIYGVSWNAAFGHLMGREQSPAVGERWERERSSGPARWWVAEAGDLVVGFASVGPSRDPAASGPGELDTIAADRVGRALMAVAVDALRSAGYTEAIVWTPAGYEQGQGFYRAMGWLPDGGRRDRGRQASLPRSLAIRESPEAR